MATTLVIKDSNFADNKVDKVTLLGNIPCTGITLEDDSIEFTAYGQTAQIEYTLTPADTTDVVSITSGNEDIVTVSGDTITAVGVGSTTVTVSCGNQSKTISISSTMNMVRYWKTGYQVGYDEQYHRAKDNAVANWGYCGSETAWGDSRVISISSTPHIYVYRIPKNTASLTINVPNSSWNTILIFFNSKQTWGNEPGAYAISGEVNYSDSVAGTRTVTIPEGADSIGIAYRTPSTTFDPSALAEYPVVFNAVSVPEEPVEE